MSSDQDPTATARAIIDGNLYMVLGTADDRGRPWVSPVYYAPHGYREFFWVSRPDARHSRNLAMRPEISIVIFDSSVPIGTGQGLYVAATAEELTGEPCAAAIEVFSRRSLGHGGAQWTVQDVQPPSQLRLYAATALAHYILGPDDRRIEIDLQ
jgi:Pyridoxamine 5'-phosphate oxidase